MNNLVIGLGNCGSQIVRAAANSRKLSDVKFYTIDSVMSSIDMATITNVTSIPIISDEKTGSGRNRERGAAMYKFHEDNGAFEQMYEDAEKAKSPVLLVTSAAGGTGSGAIVPLCDYLIRNDIKVIPIIIFPNMKDPDAYHLNANDLLIELQEVGVETYSIFRNAKGDANYTPINNEVVELIETVFGKRYDSTDLDSIDDSDLDVILSTPGRFIAVNVAASDIPQLTMALTRRVFSGFQPAWTEEESEEHTFMTAYSLTSMFADQEFASVFAEVNARIKNSYDEYRNITNLDNDGVSTASLIVAGLPRPEVKQIDTEWKEANGIGEGMKRSKRPNFMNRKKASVVSSKPTEDGDVLSQFKWK